MARIEHKSANRVDRMGAFVLLLAIVSVNAAFAAESSPNATLTPTPMPKVEVQTVGTGPHVLTALEEQKRIASIGAPATPMASLSRPDGTSRIVPWSPKTAFGKDTGFSTFLPIPGFDTRAFAGKPFVVTPNTAVEKKAGPVR